MMNGGSSAPNYRRQQKSQIGSQVGQALAERGQMQQMEQQPMDAPPPVQPAPVQQLGAGGYDPATEHSSSSTKVALAEAVGRGLSVREPENPRIRPVGGRLRLKALGIPDAEIDMLEANDPAVREG